MMLKSQLLIMQVRGSSLLNLLHLTFIMCLSTVYPTYPSPGRPAAALLTPTPPTLTTTTLQRQGGSELPGLDARCISNLIWALVKLEVATEPSSFGVELLTNMHPVVLRQLPRFTSQGLANIIWGYSKMPVPPVELMVGIVDQMNKMLSGRDPYSPPEFDAQVSRREPCRGNVLPPLASALRPIAAAEKAA